MEADRVLKKVDDLTEYGLDSPSNTVTVDTSDGTTKFNIGDENTSTNQYYISKDDDDSTVYVVAADTVTPFMKSLYDYAQGEDFPTIDSSTVKKVQVSEDKIPMFWKKILMELPGMFPAMEAVIKKLRILQQQEM